MGFLRMQEHYESDNPDFRGHAFGLEEYMEWYSREYGDGSFTYPMDWQGFNVPSTSVRAVRDHFPDHLHQERVLLSALAAAGALSEERFYVLGTSCETCPDEEHDRPDSTLAHELRHGLYFCEETFREGVAEALACYPSPELTAVLRAKGYCAEVIPDELQAYTLTGWLKDYAPTPSDLALRDVLREVEAPFLPIE
jgi:hypothetical protein